MTFTYSFRGQATLSLDKAFARGNDTLDNEYSRYLGRRGVIKNVYYIFSETDSGPFIRRNLGPSEEGSHYTLSKW